MLSRGRTHKYIYVHQNLSGLTKGADSYHKRCSLEQMVDWKDLKCLGAYNHSSLMSQVELKRQRVGPH